MKISLDRIAYSAGLILIICTIPIVAFIMLLMSAFIETIYKNPNEKDIEIVETGFNTTLPREYNSLLFVQNISGMDDYEVRIEIVLSQEQGEKYIKELEGGGQYGSYTYTESSNGNIKISLMKNSFSRANAAPEVVIRKGNKQIGKYFLKVIFVVIIYYIVIKLLLKQIRRAKEEEQALALGYSLED